jgi:hypothetical protein
MDVGIVVRQPLVKAATVEWSIASNEQGRTMCGW